MSMDSVTADNTRERAYVTPVTILISLVSIVYGKSLGLELFYSSESFVSLGFSCALLMAIGLAALYTALYLRDHGYGAGMNLLFGCGFLSLSTAAVILGIWSVLNPWPIIG